LAVAVYESAPFMASAPALEPAELLVIDECEFFRLLEEHPAFVRGLLPGRTIRLAELTRGLAELTGARWRRRDAGDASAR
jgi:CRP-like cAMP-binding protein